MFISGEGKDGAGKSTGLAYLVDKFQKEGRSVQFIHFPNYETPIGKFISDIIHGKIPMISFDALQMLYVADQLSWQEQINKWLYEGDIVVCDRYDLSTLAYYASKTGLSVDMTVNKIYDFWQHDLKKPDHTLIFECEGHAGDRRPGVKMDTLETDTTIRKFIDDVYSELGEKMSVKRSVTYIDTNGTIGQTRDQLDAFHKEITDTSKFSINKLFPKKNNPEPF